jgi:hypothetical protein
MGPLEYTGGGAGANQQPADDGGGNGVGAGNLLT